MRPSLLFLLLSFVAFARAQSDQQIFQTINSVYDEKNPVLSPDGQILYFTIGNHPENVGGRKDPGDIWFSTKNGSQWSAPVHGGTALNDKSYNAVAGVSGDGSQLFLNGHYGPAGSVARSQGISVSKKQANTWTRPENIHIPYFMNKSGLLCGSLSADNSVFVFSAESYGTYGVDDIYVTVRRQGEWTEPRNLGSVINTQFQELSPSLSADTRTLYFSSNGRKGSGSFDIYTATRLDDTWLNWSAPENLGEAINSEGRELFFRFYPAGNFALYTSTRNSDGYGDLRMYAPREPLPGHDSIVYASLDNNSPVNEPFSPTPDIPVQSSDTVFQGTDEETTDVTVHGKIQDAKTGEAVQATVSFEGPDREARAVSAGLDGYVLNLLPSAYTIRIEANGYISSLEKLDIADFEMKTLEMNFVLQPVEIGTTVNLKNVLFAQAKTDILQESYVELDLVIDFLNANPTVRIELMGHTDGRGVPADNIRLSQQRVNKVKEYLVSKGIAPRRISGKGFGGSKPIASNDTEESRRMNRRVEFVIKKF